MLNHSTTASDSQEAERSKSTEILIDERFPWTARKVQTLHLSDVYWAAGFENYSQKARWCSTYLEYNAMMDGRRTLKTANFCNLRLCPLCTARRARRAALRLSKVLDRVEADHKGVMYIFLTLTILNVGDGGLSAGIDQLMAGFNRLMQQRPIRRAVMGWFRALEITHDDTTGYHPHFHVILAVEPAYFSRKAGLYITQRDWEARWGQALKVSYRPRVDIRTTRSKGRKAGNLAAALEAAKYAVKSGDYLTGKGKPAHIRIDPDQPESLRQVTPEQVRVVTEYTHALRKRRLLAFGGWLKEAAKALNMEQLEDGDLVHIDDDAIRDDVAELLEVYRWNFGMGDYILESREYANGYQPQADSGTDEVQVSE